jgi:hypothetical protein
MTLPLFLFPVTGILCPSIAWMVDSPVANNVAIAVMSVRCLLPIQDLEGMEYAKHRLDSFKNKVSSNNA